MKTAWHNLSAALRNVINSTVPASRLTGGRQDLIALMTGKLETIVVPNGTFTLKEVHLAKDMRFTGTGPGSRLKLPTDLTTSIRGIVDGQEAMQNAMFLINSPVNIIFVNLTFDGDFFNQAEPYNGGTFLRVYKPTGEGRINVTFKNCRFVNVNHSAIQAYGTDVQEQVFVRVEGCTFDGGAKGTHTGAIPDKWAYGFAPHFIGLYDEVDLYVTGCTFMDDVLPNNTDTFARIALYASVTATATTADSDRYSASVSFHNNIFKNLGRSDAAGNGLGVLDMYVNGENAVISGNKFYNSQMQSIRGKVNVKNLVVTDNIVKDGIDGAIAFHPNNYATKKGNVIIANNLVENCMGYGILLNGDSRTDAAPYFENAIVNGNNVRGIGQVPYRADLANGIFLKKVKNVTVTANHLTDILKDGIALEAVENVKIDGNTIMTTTNDAGVGRGIYGTLLRGSVVIRGNHIRSNVAAMYITFDSATTTLEKRFIFNDNTISEVRNCTSQAVYVANFFIGIASTNVVDGMVQAEGSTAYAFNFKGGFLMLMGNMYADVSGGNKDATGTSKGIKLKGNVTTLYELNNSWQTA